MSLHCLLIAPNNSGKDTTGEDAFVRSLLEFPPAGIDYEHYTELLGSGRARRQPWVHKLFSRLAQTGFLRPAPWLETLTTDEKFDLIHIHGFDVRLHGKAAAAPVVLSASSFGPADCADYWRWSTRRIARYQRRLKFFFRLLGIFDASSNRRGARRLLVWSKRAQKLHIASGAQADSVLIVPPGIELPAPRMSHGRNSQLEVLFVGRDFRRKGGEVLLQAWEKINNSAARLTIVGDCECALPKSIRHFPYRSPEELKRDFYPHTDILVLPSLAEGYGMVVLEAMAHSLAVVASNLGAIPEMVAEGETGFLVAPGDAEQLAGRLKRLINQPDLCRQMGEAGRKRAFAFFSIEHRNRLLKEAYHQATEDFGHAAQGECGLA